MRLGRRLSTGVAEHPPVPAPRQPERAERTAEVPREAEVVPAELAAER